MHASTRVSSVDKSENATLQGPGQRDPGQRWNSKTCCSVVIQPALSKDGRAENRSQLAQGMCCLHSMMLHMHADEGPEGLQGDLE